jgi:hypothetical protein
MRIILLAVMVMFPIVSVAQISLSVTSYQGGTSLNFGRVDTTSVETCEVKIKVNSTAATPYQVRQVILEPPVNEKGTPLKDEVLFFYTVRGSNSRGSLYNTILKPLSFREDILYVSDTQGSSDSFKLIYIFDGKKLATTGHFLGRIGYILEPKEGSPQTTISTIEFDARIKLEGKISPKNLKLSTKIKEDYSKYVDFSLKCEDKKRVEIYQRVEEPLLNYKGKKLPRVLSFYISDSLRGKGEYKSPIELEEKEVLIYTSNEGSDDFKINFLLDEEKVKSIEAGLYKGRLVYRILQEGKEKLIPLNLEVDVAKLFNIKIITEELSFYNLKPGLPPQDREVTIKVESNLDVPYQVSQILTSPLTDEKGNTIPSKYFTMKEILVEGEGEVVYDQFRPLSEKEEAIFFSDDKGGPATFKIIYRLTPSLEIVAGRYSTSITYSLSER